ncbi:unnamed protein product [Spodoptera exigua]|nr:unnamed protein product [Spodoptera exigua]
MRRVGVLGKLDFDFIMTFAVMDSDFGACELRDNIVVHAVGARALLCFQKLTVRCVGYCKRDSLVVRTQASCEVECNGAIAAATSETRNARYAKKAHLKHIVLAEQKNVLKGTRCASQYCDADLLKCRGLFWRVLLKGNVNLPSCLRHIGVSTKTNQQHVMTVHGMGDVQSAFSILKREKQLLQFEGDMA